MRAEERAYRPAAVRRLAAGEALDDLPRFVPAHEWLVVAAAGLILAAVLAWGLFGSVSAPGVPAVAPAFVPCDSAAAPAAERIPPIRLLVPAGR